jgi:hypothetical protein
MQSYPEHKKKLLVAGIVISNLLNIMIMGLLYSTFFSMDTESADIALILIGNIFITTFISSVASYFWSLGGFELKTIRNVAPANALLTLSPYIINTGLHSIYFFIMAVIILLFCSQLGAWFGRRVYFE